MTTTYRHITQLRLLSKKVAAGFSADDIHELRVEAKKLRALLRLAGPDDRRFPKTFRHIYKAAGEIRNLQLLRRRLTAFRAGACPTVRGFLRSPRPTAPDGET